MVPILPVNPALFAASSRGEAAFAMHADTSADRATEMARGSDRDVRVRETVVLDSMSRQKTPALTSIHDANSMSSASRSEQRRTVPGCRSPVTIASTSRARR
jgi:hypothetical protein